ncbi:hypothetical protein GPJ56_000111 [Histomonas meleagridis]|uniref:uncharacterized protein n=1 Tax=Histomonas meleagridis TaxID=135588 RepID=UPI003559F925|nr:hypothetical protein GPJ56_000111 [Histomonas meleagridis]KAH0805610.1 hypothetical protein GO595_001665 [Histomonas meleagridis]
MKPNVKDQFFIDISDDASVQDPLDNTENITSNSEDISNSFDSNYIEKHNQFGFNLREAPKQVNPPLARVRKKIEIVPDFHSLISTSKSPSDFIPLDAIKSSINAIIKQNYDDIDDFLSESSKHMNSINELCNLISNYKNIIRYIRRNFILKELYHRKNINRCSKIITSIQSNIQTCEQFLKFLDKYCHDHKAVPSVDLDKFFLNFLQPFPDLTKVEKEISLLSKVQRQYIQVHLPRNDWVCIITSMKRRSGRVIHRFLENLQEMTYPDAEVIIKAICESSPKMYTRVRTFIFERSWQLYLFPFSSVHELRLPKIFDLTPRVFGPPFFPSEYIDVPFSKLNSTDWPLREISEKFFVILVQCDPFIIADLFWDVLAFTTDVTQKLKMLQSNNQVDDAPGFDELFSYMLVCVFAFGVDELLEMLEYCAQFSEYELKSSDRQFAMAHCEGLVQHIKKLNENELRKKFYGK